MPGARIVCLGSPYQAADWVGPAVLAALTGRTGAEVELIDGGLQGLNLLCRLEGVARVVFADTLDGNYPAPTVLTEPFAADAGLRFGHGGGLAYLLAAARAVLSPLPRLWVVGASAAADRAVIEPLARRCLELAGGQS